MLFHQKQTRTNKQTAAKPRPEVHGLDYTTLGTVADTWYHSKAKADTKPAGAREEDAEDSVRWRLMIHCDDLRREELKGKEGRMDGRTDGRGFPPSETFLEAREQQNEGEGG